MSRLALTTILLLVACAAAISAKVLRASTAGHEWIAIGVGVACVVVARGRSSDGTASDDEARQHQGS